MLPGFANRAVNPGQNTHFLVYFHVMNFKRIYFDFAATTPLNKSIAKAMRDFELEFYGNPSSTHREGQLARAKIDFARATVAKFLNAKPQEIIFTSGATEANNLAIQGVVAGRAKPHVVTTLLEHQSIYNQVKDLEKRGVVEATYVKPDKNGVITAGKIIEAIKPNTVLVSVIFVSNEIGTILPVREIGEKLPKGILFHIDAVQAAQFLNLNVEKLNCHLLTISAHKIYGPKGIGILYVRSGVKLQNLSVGGSQEYGKRPGTQNTPGIIGLALAIEKLGSLESRQEVGNKISELRDQFIKKIIKIPSLQINGPTGEMRIPNNISATINGVDQDALMTALDLAGIAASTGSACVSGSSEPSHVIQALDSVKVGQAATVRFTLGRDSTLKEVKYVTKTLAQIISQLRK